MSLRKHFKTDESIEREGVEYLAGGCKFLLARSGGGNVKYNRMMERLCKPYRKQIQSQTLDDKVSERIAHEVFAATVLLGWEGVTYEDLGLEGEGEAPCTMENKLLLFAELPELFRDLQDISGERSAYLMEIREEDAGN